MDQLKKIGFVIKEAFGLLKVKRTQSAPSIVGRVEGDHEKKERYPKQERSSSCGDLISKSRDIPKDCSESSKGARKLLKKIKGRTGVLSPDENVNFENRKQSLNKVSNPNVSKTDDPEEPDKTTKGSRISSSFSSKTGVYSVQKNESFKKRKQSRFKRLKSKVSVGECSEGSFEFETETGVPELTVFTVNTNDNASSYTKSEEVPVEETNPLPKNEHSLVSVKTRQAEEFKTAQTKFHSMAENVEFCFDDRLKQCSPFGESLREEEGNLLKHPKSKTIAITERDSGRESKSSVQYIYYNAKHFQHFYYIYNLTRECHDHMDGLRKTNDRTNFMAKDVVIKIGIVGEFTEDKLNLLSKRRGTKEMPPHNQKIWEQSPILCFQESTESALKMLRREKACHKILVISDPNYNETKKVEDSIFTIGEDKEHILRMISICLEEQIHQLLQEWLLNLPVEGFGKNLPGIVTEIKDIRKQILTDENNQHTTDASALRGAVNKSIVPSNVKEYLLGSSDVNSFGIWNNSSVKLFVKKTTNVKKLKHRIKKLNKTFFKTYNLEIVKGRLVALKSLRQGENLLLKDGETSHAGTLGGFVTKTDDENKIYALTCNHIFPSEELLAYTCNSTDEDIHVGTCVFTTRDGSCDFAAIEINESFSNNCEVPLRREDKKKTRARIFDESLEQISIVHKIGATTNITNGSICCSEYYDRDMPDNLFLVKGTRTVFSEKGDSGSLVFSRPKTGRQNYINVVGMVFGNNYLSREDYSDDDQKLEKDTDLEGFPKNDAEEVEANVDEKTSSNTPASSVGDDDQNTENLSCCYRIHPAFDLFKEEKGVEVKFKDDLPTPSSSPDDSYEETN